MHFFKIEVLKNLANSTGKHLCWSFFSITLKRKACNFIKNRLQHKCFPMKFENFLRTPFFRTYPVAASENNEQPQLLRVLSIFATRQFNQFFYKNSLTILPSASTAVEHFYLLKIAMILVTRTTYFKLEPPFLIDQLRTYRILMLDCIKSIFFN